MIKRLLQFIFTLVFLILLFALGVTTLIFLRPDLVVTPSNLNFALEKTRLLKSWSWKNAAMRIDWMAWNHRHLHGKFTDICFDYERPSLEAKGCLQEISWDFELHFEFSQGPWVTTRSPFRIRSEKFRVIMAQEPEDEPNEPPPDIYSYWTRLWSPLIPDMDFQFHEIHMVKGKKDFKLDLNLLKRPQALTLKTSQYTLEADPKSFKVFGPKKIPIPEKSPVLGPYYIRDALVEGKVTKAGIPLEVTALVEVAKVRIDSFIKLPLVDSFSSVEFQKSVLLQTKGEIEVPALKESIKHVAPDPFKELPAPLNVMDGKIMAKITTQSHTDPNLITILNHTIIDLASQKQVLAMEIGAEVPINLKNYETGIIDLMIEFKKVVVQLPRLSKKSRPPQFLPDSRFVKKKPEEKKSKKVDLHFHLEALNEKALHLRSNLLDEALRLNFDLNIVEGTLKNGFIAALPLKTKIFKRPLIFKKTKVTFQHPVEPVLDMLIEFPLPEYKITLKLEGPLSKPRHAFSSVPPLGENDILAVLLFGKPMSDLGADDKSAAQQTNQILAQGILSLSVLYFLAGSPVEYIGYDPESKKAVAQFGINKKTSLRVGGSDSGMNSTTVRRSLGKGWYLDTSVQNPNNTNATSDKKNYGVILERVIAY